jgi:hypothetical protein
MTRTDLAQRVQQPLDARDGITKRQVCVMVLAAVAIGAAGCMLGNGLELLRGRYGPEGIHLLALGIFIAVPVLMYATDRMQNPGLKLTWAWALYCVYVGAVFAVGMCLTPPANAPGTPTFDGLWGPVLWGIYGVGPIAVMFLTVVLGIAADCSRPGARGKGVAETVVVDVRESGSE